MDLMQEKNIKQLKKMSQKRNAMFGGGFFKQIVAVNIREFIEAIGRTNAFVGLAKRGSSHKRTEKPAVARQFARTLDERHIHKFCSGRETQRLASDDFDAGQRRLENTSRIKDFIERTILDAGAIHTPEDEVPQAHDINLNPAPVELPNMLVDGELVVVDEETLDNMELDGEEADDIDLLAGDSDEAEMELGSDDEEEEPVLDDSEAGSECEGETIEHASLTEM